MDQVSAGKATGTAPGRRRRMRERARSQHAGPVPATDRYQTPEWLERSFVLPLTEPEASDLPSQPVPHHDDDPDHHPTAPAVGRHRDTGTLPAPVAADPGAADPTTSGAAGTSAASFVRPPSQDIDFARVIRRSDLLRTVGRVCWGTGGLAGLTLIAYLLTTSTLVLAAVVVLALAAAVALAVRLRLSRAPVPHLRR